MHDAQARLGDLEAELHRLKPLLAIQSSLPLQSLRRESTQSSMPYPYSPYTSTSIHVPPFTSTTPQVPFIPYSTSSLHDVNQKRKREGPIKGKEKEATNQDIDANADDDSDNADAPLTPTATSSTSHNPYAYMNNLYRHVLSPSNTAATSPATPKPKPPGALNSASLGAQNNSSSTISPSHYAVAYSPYSFPTTTLPKQSSSTAGGSKPTPSRQDDADKDSGRVETNVGIHTAGQEKGKSTPASSRRTAAVSTRQQVKYKTSSILGDARAEHLLLAARKIGRGRAITIAGLAKAQERTATEESSKDKPKAKDVSRHLEASHSSVLAGRSTQRRRVTGINSPTTPTPKRVHGNLQPLTEASSLATTPTASRTREVLFGSAKAPRNRPSVPDITASLINAGKDDEVMSGAGQTPLDSLLSAARTMMTKDREGGPAPAVQSVASNVVTGTNRDIAEQPSEESQGELEGVRRRKRRRNTTTQGTTTVTPRTHTAEKHGATPSGIRTKSALDVLADQAAAAFEGSSTTYQEVDLTENSDNNGPSTSNSNSYAGSSVDARGPASTSSIHELALHTEGPISTPTSAAAETDRPGQIERSIESAGSDGFGMGFGAGETRTTSSPFQQPASATTDQVGIGDRVATPAEGVAASSTNSSSSDPGQDSGRRNWDPFGGMPNTAPGDSGGISEGDMDAEGDIDPDSQESSLDGNGVIHQLCFCPCSQRALIV